MNKKYLSVILFGALMLGTTGTFTSCKDYDDDINQINKELTDIKSAISELQSKVDNGKYVTNITKEGEGIKITWNDNSTSVIETIKGDKGADGTIVTIIDGYWAFDGVKSEYPAVGKDGADGADGQDGQNGQDGHDAKISEDGYWMVWDAEKGEYTKTEYIAGGVTAVETAGGWNLTVRDENGDVQTIFIPTSSTMGYMDILNGDKYMYALYGINEKDVTYGPNDKVLAKGLYTTLDRDLMIVVNPQGTDASAYEYSLMNSANVNTGLLFKDAVPYEGVLDIYDVPATRATSENAIWRLPHDFTRYEDIDDARTKNYLLFKANDQNPYALSLTATLNNTTVKTPYDLGARLKKIGNVTVSVDDLRNCAVNTKYEPVINYVSPSVDAAAVYDYWLTFEQSADNLKDVALYGAEIVDEGHKFVYKRETGVNNSIKLLFNYILMDGTVVEGKDAVLFYAYMREEMAASKEITLERLNVPMDAKYVDGKDNKLLNTIYGAYSANKVFALNTEAYPLTDLLSQMSDIEKAVWYSAIDKNMVTVSIIGGEGDNNQDNTNFEKGYNLRYAIVDDAITFQFCVSEEYPEYANFKLNNAYQLTFTVLDEDTHTPVASIILPFEFTQPTLDITRVNGEKALWNDKKNVLSMYGDLSGNYMYVPLYEAFSTAYSKTYTEFVPNAEYYVLRGDNTDKVRHDGKFLGEEYQFLNNSLIDIVASSKAVEWNTFINKADVELNTAEFLIDADYTFYGVYPATDEQVSDFTLRFASLLGDATSVKANGEFTSNNVTREVILTDADFTLTDALGDTFYLFDGVKSDGNVDKRSDMNLRQGFEEGTEGFETTFTLAKADIKAYYYKNGVKTNINVKPGQVNEDGNGFDAATGTLSAGNAYLYVNKNTKTRTWIPGVVDAANIIVTDLPAAEAVKSDGYAAIPGGVMIQLPSSIGTTEPVTIEFGLKDVFGVTKTLSVTVKAAK